MCIDLFYVFCYLSVKMAAIPTTTEPSFLLSGYAGAVGSPTADLQHHQTRAEEEPTGRAGRPQVL